MPLHGRDIYEIPNVGYESETRFTFKLYADDISVIRRALMACVQLLIVDAVLHISLLELEYTTCVPLYGPSPAWAGLGRYRDFL